MIYISSSLAMGSVNLWLLICIITTFVILRDTQFSAHSIFNNNYHHQYGPPTHVTQNLYFPAFDPITSPIKLLGSATISSSNRSGGLIQIPDASSPTVDLTHQAGRAIYSSPIRLFDPHSKTPASFHTTFSFRFSASNGGNGLAFVLVPDEFTIGRSGPWLGMLNDACGAHNRFFAVEFDNSRDREFGDPNNDHVGVNLGSVVSYKTVNASEARVSLNNDSVLRAWIEYDGQRRWIEIRLGLDSDPIPAQPILSSELNLAPFLQEYMFVGFSASTGNSTQLHSVLSWNFSSSSQAFLRLPSKKICHGNVAHQVSKYSAASPSNRPSGFLIFVAVLSLATAASITLYCNGRIRTSMDFALPEKKRRPVRPSMPRRFTILEVYRVTKRFGKTEVLGSDSRGVTYRGTMPNGCFVGVKRFSTQFPNWSRVLKRIGALVRFEHANLAPIRGWCFENRETVIVYDYYQNGSLEKWLYGVGVLPWTLRFKLIKDIAESLSFLHSKELAHGNLSATSVFLDSNYRAVLGDYGFGASGRVESVSGQKADVFGFGALVLEAVAGKKIVESAGDGDRIDILGFAWSMHEKGEIEKVVDERMESGVDPEQMIRVVEIGLSCTLDRTCGRPSMEEVGQFLNMLKPIPKLPASRPAELSP